MRAISRAVLILVLAATLFPAPAADAAIVKTYRIVDVNGDRDGYPDANETLDLYLTIRNPSGSAGQTNIAVLLTTEDPKIDCVIQPLGALATMEPGLEVEIPTPFRFHVHPDAKRSGPSVLCENPGPSGVCSNFVRIAGGCVADAECRCSASEEYAALFSVTVSSDQQPNGATATLALDLGLDSADPLAPTRSFFEGFESGFGSFRLDNLDANKASNSASDGYRCQYNNPDFVNSNWFGQTECYLGFTAGQSPVNDWHVHSTTAVDGGRAFEGVKSLHFGRHTAGQPEADSTSLSNLDAIRTTSDVNLATRVCSSDPSPGKRSCNTDADCGTVGGGPCVPAEPELSFVHQVAMANWRIVGGGPDRTVDRAVVQVQPAGSVWRNLAPFENVRDALPFDRYANCAFDPIDDGNDEDSFFDPTDPQRRLGPSSTCYPEPVFSHMGDTEAPFDPGNVGAASDPPGLAGSIGAGTWVRSRFDLTPYRGRSVKIRFLATTLEVQGFTSWWNVFGDPTPDDDGWYVDDVRVAQTLGATSSTLTVDVADNDALPGNADRDARGDDCDCAPADPAAFAAPGEVSDVRLASDKASVTWRSAIPQAGAGTVHDVLRGLLSALPVGTGGVEVCLVSGTQAAAVADPSLPVAAAGWWYLVRSRNACGIGSYGFRSDGVERASAACP